MTTNTDFKPGDIVRCPKRGLGLVRSDLSLPGAVVVAFTDADGYTANDYDLTGWEKVETVQPGHVQVKVDDLDLSGWVTQEEKNSVSVACLVAIRAAKALATHTRQPDEPTEFGARVMVLREKFIRTNDADFPWMREDHEEFMWDSLTKLGPITIGWEEDGETK